MTGAEFENKDPSADCNSGQRCFLFNPELNGEPIISNPDGGIKQPTQGILLHGICHDYNEIESNTDWVDVSNSR